MKIKRVISKININIKQKILYNKFSYICNKDYLNFLEFVLNFFWEPVFKTFS